MCYTAESNVNLSLTITKPGITIILHCSAVHCDRTFCRVEKYIYIISCTYIRGYEPGGSSRWNLGRTHSAIRRNNYLPMLYYYYIPAYTYGVHVTYYFTRSRCHFTTDVWWPEDWPLGNPWKAIAQNYRFPNNISYQSTIILQRRNLKPVACTSVPNARALHVNVGTQVPRVHEIRYVVYL